MTLYDTLISSHITYCNIIWGATYKISIQKIYNLQKKALKLCSGKTSSQRIYRSGLINKPAICTNKSIFQSTKKLSVYNINKYQTVIFIYKTLHNLSPTCFQNLFKLLSNVHSHNTRAEGKNNLFAQNAKHTLRKFALSVRAPTLWNSIPSSIRHVIFIF